MKLWFLTTEYPPNFGGGIGTYMQHAALMFAQAGHEVTVFVQDKQNDIQQTGLIRVIRFCASERELFKKPTGPEPDQHPTFPFNVMAHWPALSYRFAQRVRQQIQKEGPPDIIEVQEYGGLGYYLQQQKLLGCPELNQVPILIHLHTPSFEIHHINRQPAYRLTDYWIGQMEKFSILAADKLLCPSNFLKQRLIQTMTGGDHDLDINVIRLPFKTTSSPQQNAMHLEGHSEQKNIVYVGRLEPRKGVLPLLAACDRLWQQGQAFKLTMVGGDTTLYARDITVGQYLRRRYGHWVKQGRLQFTGNLPPAQCAGKVQQAWAVTVPSLYENFPLTCIEAMHAGKLVIASDTGGQSEMVGSADCGRIFSWSQKGALENCLTEVLQLTPEQVKATGERAKKRIQDMTDYARVLPQRLEMFEKMRRQVQDKKTFPSVNVFDARRVYRENQLTIKSEAKLLSVVITYYNLGQYIDETLQSAFNSDYRPMEIVIVNDGSTDRQSLDKLQEIEAKNLPEVRILHTPNMGLASARNNGAQYARGEYLAFLDADDLVAPEFYTRSIEILKRYTNVSLVYSWVRYFDGNKGCFIANNLEFPFLLAHNMLAAICVLKRADFLAFALNNPQMEYGLEDYESWISLYESGRLGVCIPEFLTFYRIRPESMLRGMNENQMLSMYDEIVRLHRTTYQQYGPEVFQLLNANGASYAWNAPSDPWQSSKPDPAQQIPHSTSPPLDPHNIGLKMALWAVWFGVIRKTKQLLTGFKKPDDWS